MIIFTSAETAVFKLTEGILCVRLIRSCFYSSTEKKTGTNRLKIKLVRISKSIRQQKFYFLAKKNSSRNRGRCFKTWKHIHNTLTPGLCTAALTRSSFPVKYKKYQPRYLKEIKPVKNIVMTITTVNSSVLA